MKRSSPHPFPTFVLFFTGICAIIYIFWALEHQFSESLTTIWTAMGIFFICFLWGFFRILQWRDYKAAQHIQAQPTTAPVLRPELKGTVYGLTPGSRYQVVRPFSDFYGNTFEKGEELHFQTRHFLPYDGGHTIVFENRRLYLQEDKNKEILDNFSNYIIKIE